MRGALFPLGALLLLGGLVFAADRKPLPNQAGNDDLDIFATVILDRQEIRQAVGEEMPEGFAVVRVRVVPKADQSLRVGPDDFTLLSRKDGDRSQALEPEQITSKAGLIVKAAREQPSRMSTVSNGPIWGGVKETHPVSANNDRDRDNRDQPPDRGDRDRAADQDAAKPEATKPEAVSPLLAALKAKSVPDQESKKQVEGLLYFPVDSKVKAKDLALIYKSPNGRLVVDFK